MLTDILSLSVLARIVSLVAGNTSDQRRQPAALDPTRRQTAHLAAQVAAIDPQLERRLRRVSGRIASLATALESELCRFRPLEQRFEQVAGQVEEVSAHDSDGELLECLAEQFGVLQVRPALQRLQDAHPDTPTTASTD
jgi:hypothetical protein